MLDKRGVGGDAALALALKKMEEGDGPCRSQEREMKLFQERKDMV